MESVVVGGVRLGYERVGSGRPVLLVGGTGMPPITWQITGVRDALVAAGFEVISHAARGIVPSDAPPPPYTVDDLAADAAGLLDALDRREVAVVGYSLGSFTAERLAQLRPDLVRCAVLLAGAGPMTPVLGAALAMERELIAMAGRIPPSAAAFQTLMAGLPPSSLRDDDNLVGQWVQMLGMQERMWTSIEGENGQSAAADRWVHDKDRMAALGDITIPVLVAAYEHDLMFPPRCGRVAAEVLPRGEFVEIPHAGHAGLMTHPEQTVKALAAFLAGN